MVFREYIAVFKYLPTMYMGKSMQSTIDERGRVLIPSEFRAKLGLSEGTVVEVEQDEKAVLITPVRKKLRSWASLSGFKPKRTGKPEWPTPEEIKSIWE